MYILFACVLHAIWFFCIFVEKSMHTLQIRKLPENIYMALKEEAERERRSINQQAIIVLMRGLQEPEGLNRRKKVLEEIRQEQHLYQQWKHIDTANWIREDRDYR